LLSDSVRMPRGGRLPNNISIPLDPFPV